MASKISKIQAREVLDSRGNPTVQATVFLKDGLSASANAPSGASTGTFEALELRDGGARFGGKGVLRAVSNVNGPIARALEGMDVSKQEEIDLRLCEMDGTPDKSRLGANATAAVSMACLQAAAREQGVGAYRQIGEGAGGSSGGAFTLPVPFMNVINGGKHAGSGLAVQEFMLAPVGFSNFSDALRAGVETYHSLRGIVAKQYGPLGTSVGDEGGFAPPIRTSAEALQVLEDAIAQAGYTGKVKLASDPAASSFYDAKTGFYKIDGKELEKGELIDYWAGLCKEYPIVSLEDPFEEGDYNSFSALREKLAGKVQIVGDDLTVTNLRRVKKAHKERSISALLLKVNQIGTISEALESAQFCLSHHMGVMVSHRSGETEDATIADLAVGLGCGQIKTGAPCRGERTAKYNRLLAIEEELGKKAKFLGEKALVF
ncbi:MAG: phosphopyruvate hydratase [Candidatus Micrarchaeota archaeon]